MDNEKIVRTTQELRTARCRHCYGRGAITVLPGRREVECRCVSATPNLGTRRHGMIGVDASKAGKHGNRGRLPKGTKSTKPTFCSYQPEPMTKEEMRRVVRLGWVKKEAEQKRRRQLHKLGKKA